MVLILEELVNLRAMNRFIILLALGCLISWQSVNRIPTPLKSGDKAPDIELLSPSGKTTKLSKLKGKMVLIDFWASWCGPCRKENPNVVEAYAKYNSMRFKNAKGFEVYSVSLDRAEDVWKKAIIDDKLTWKNHGWDKEGKAAKVYNVNAIPTAFLIDGDGMIVASGPELRGIGLHLTLDKQLK